MNEPIQDSESFRSLQTFSYRDIILRQVQKIVTLYSRELTESFWKKTQPTQYGTQEVLAYIPDGRLGFIQAVEILHDLLMPKFDGEMQKDAKDIEEQLTKVKEKNIGSKVKLMRKMFQQLCLFLERLGWLEASEFKE